MIVKTINFDNVYVFNLLFTWCVIWCIFMCFAPMVLMLHHSSTHHGMHHDAIYVLNVPQCVALTTLVVLPVTLYQVCKCMVVLLICIGLFSEKDGGCCHAPLSLSSCCVGHQLMLDLILPINH